MSDKVQMAIADIDRAIALLGRGSCTGPSCGEVASCLTRARMRLENLTSLERIALDPSENKEATIAHLHGMASSIHAVCNVSLDALQGARGERAISDARALFYYVALHEWGIAPQIAADFLNRGASSVRSGAKMFSEMISVHRELAEKLTAFRAHFAKNNPSTPHGPHCHTSIAA